MQNLAITIMSKICHLLIFLSEVLLLFMYSVCCSVCVFINLCSFLIRVYFC